MGIFDFAKNVGAKIGIGESTQDEAKRKQAEAAKANLEKIAKARQAQRAARAKQTAIERQKQAAVDADEARKEAQMSQEIQDKFKDLQKADGLEKYLGDLGISINGLDIRYHDGLATITGTAADQATREKAILAIGNVEGVEQVHDAIKVSADSAESATHVVASGDTLWAIAQKQYGDGNKYPAIFEANKPMLSDPDKIYVGQVLRIPVDA